MFAKFVTGLILAAALAFAQGGMGGGQMGGGGMGGGGMVGGRNRGNMGAMGGGTRAQRQSRSDLLASRLKLKGDQKSQLQDILSAARQEATPLQQQLLQARSKIANAEIDGKSDADMKPLLDSYSALAAQMGNVEARAFSKLYAILKAKQQSKAAQNFDLLAGTIETPDRGAASGRGQ